MVLLRHVYFKLRGKNILCGNRVTVYGLDNIAVDDCLEIAVQPIGFLHREDRTLLNVRGRMHVRGKFLVGRGCRFDIGKDALVSVGTGYVTANTTFIIMHGLSIGDDCAISWGCQFLDEDFHDIQYPGKPAAGDSRIRIGSHVWIGCNVSILKGAVIPDGCVIASGSVVRSKFDTENALIAGNPAKIIKENVTWSETEPRTNASPVRASIPPSI